MFKQIKLFTIFLGLLVGVSLVMPVQALGQVTTLDPEEYRITKASILDLYTDQIQAYQQVYRRYSLATAQYTKIGSLAALGELIESAKESMLKRGEVMLSYTDLLHLELRFVSNVDPTQKRELLTSLEALHKSFEDQQNLIAKSQDYQAINARALSFSEIIIEYDRVVFETKTAIFTGRVKSSDFVARNFFEQIEQSYKQDQKTGFVAVERQRARDEIIAAVAKVDDLWAEVMELNTERLKTPNQRWYTEYITKLTAVQNQLVFLLNYLEEASKL